MKVIVGLGNPGKLYQSTRHNVGFIFLDILRKELDLPTFKEEKKFQADISKANDCVLVKPLTFMNKSGTSISKYLNYFKINPENIMVIHDDIDLKLGKVKIGFGEGDAGHNGVRSLINRLGTKEFWRIRIGILSRSKEEIKAEEFVLEKFSKKEFELIEEIIYEATQEIKTFLNNKIKPRTISLD